MTWTPDNYPRATRDIEPGAIVSSYNLLAPDPARLADVHAIAGEHIRQGDGVTFSHPYAWSVATSRG